MNRDEQKMDKIFREKLEGFSTPPPADLWNSIQGNLNKKAKRGIILFRSIAAAAVVTLALIAGWLFNDKTELTSQPIAEITVEETITTPSETINQTKVEHRKTSNAINTIKPSDLLNTINNPSTIPTPIKTKPVIQNEISFSNKRKESGFTLLAGIGGLLKELEIIDNLKFTHQKTQKAINDLTSNEKELIALNTLKASRDKNKTNNWEVGVQVSPGYSSQRTSHSENYQKNMTYSNSNGDADMGGGLSIEYKTGKRWSVESGIYYSQNGQNSGNSMDLFSATRGASYEMALNAPDYFNTPVSIKHGQIIMNSTAGVVNFSKTPKNAEVSTNLDAQSNFSNSLITTGDFQQVFDFIEIPLYLRYNLVDKEIDIELIGGFSANILVGNNVIMNGNENIGKTADISKLNYSGTLGIGFAYAINKRISISIEPRFNYYLNSINKNKEVNYRPYRIGIYTGLNYNF